MRGWRRWKAGNRRGVAALAATALAALLAAGGAWAADVYVDVSINGQTFAGAGYVDGDRVYVSLDDLARAVGGAAVYDGDLKLAMVNTGRYVDLTLDRISELNPALNAYKPASSLEPEVGVRYGVAAPHLSVAAMPSGPIAAVEWVNPAHAQRVDVVDRTLLVPGGMTELAFNGERIELSAGAFLWVGDALYVRLRDVAEASGGGVGWDAEQRIATAKVVPGGDLTIGKLVGLNPALAQNYAVRDGASGSEFSPAGPGIVVGYEPDGGVVWFEAVFSASVGWFPWFDQAQGETTEFETAGKAYTQRIAVAQP